MNWLREWFRKYHRETAGGWLEITVYPISSHFPSIPWNNPSATALWPGNDYRVGKDFRKARILIVTRIFIVHGNISHVEILAPCKLCYVDRLFSVSDPVSVSISATWRRTLRTVSFLVSDDPYGIIYLVFLILLISHCCKNWLKNLFIYMLTYKLHSYCLAEWTYFFTWWNLFGT